MWFKKKKRISKEEVRHAEIPSPKTTVRVTGRRPTAPKPVAEAPPPAPAPVAPLPDVATPSQMRQAEFVLAEGIVTIDVLRNEIQRAAAEAHPLGRALLAQAYPDLMELARVLGNVAIPSIDLDQISPSEEALRRLPAETARARDCLPVEVFGNILCVAMARPEDLSGIKEIRDVTGLRVKALRVDGAAVRAMIARHYPAPELRSFMLRPLPVSLENYKRARRRNRLANDLMKDWESCFVHGDVMEAEAVTGNDA
jgi:MshEN domain